MKSIDGRNFDSIHQNVTTSIHFSPTLITVLQAKWYDPKSHSSGLKYEFAMSIRRPNLVWMRGPLPAGEMHDGTMYRGGTKKTPMKDRDRNALYFMLPKGEFIACTIDW